MPDPRHTPQPGDTMTHLPSGEVSTVVRVEDTTVYYLDPASNPLQPDRVYDMDLGVWSWDPVGTHWAWASAPVAAT